MIMLELTGYALVPGGLEDVKLRKIHGSLVCYAQPLKSNALSVAVSLRSQLNYSKMIVHIIVTVFTPRLH